MRFPRTLLRLLYLIIPLSLATGLFALRHGAVVPEPVQVTTLRGTSATLFGAGLYRDDSLFFAAGFIAQDLVMTLLALPLLGLAVLLMRRGRSAGLVLASAALGYMLYTYASLAFSAAYNDAFFSYTLLLSLCLFAIRRAQMDLSGYLDPARFRLISPRLPRKALAVFLTLSGLITLFIWSTPLVVARQEGLYPARLDHYTSEFTAAIDIAVIAPLCLACAYWVWQNQPGGYVLALPLLGTLTLLVPGVLIATPVQAWAGIQFSAPEMAGPIAGFVALGLYSTWLIYALVRRLSSP